MPETDIDRLVKLARDGDVEAFGLLYDTFASRVFRFFRFRAASLESAEDLTQKVFLKMIEQMPSFHDRGVPFGAWLFRVARNTWIDEHRTSHPAAPLDSLVDSAADEAGPEDLAADAFDWRLVAAEIGRLSSDQREVIECRFMAGLSPRETATQMGRSEGSVRVLQHRALAALRSRLGRLAPIVTTPAPTSAGRGSVEGESR